MKHATPDPKRAAEVYFDGGCPLCRREIAAYRSIAGDDGIRWRDVSVAGGQPAPDLTREAALARFHVRRADGVLVSGAEAFLSVWRGAGRLRHLARLLDRQPFLWIAERGYRGFLALRKAWRRA